MALTYNFMGEFHKAREYYETAMQNHEAANNEPRLINMCFELFVLAMHFEQEVEAKGYLEKLTELSQRGQAYGKVAILVHKILEAKLLLSHDSPDNTMLAKRSLYGIINNPDIKWDSYITFAYLILLNKIIAQYYDDPRYLKEIESLIPKMQKYARKLSAHSIVGLTYWIQYKLRILEGKTDEAESFKEKAKIAVELSHSIYIYISNSNS
ncbi:MAG: hypothetical protein ACXAD7_13835 [Candidatus Kariarchaeaceae archaeon]|jgi:hypothetical protein